MALCIVSHLEKSKSVFVVFVSTYVKLIRTLSLRLVLKYIYAQLIHIQRPTPFGLLVLTHCCWSKWKCLLSIVELSHRTHCVGLTNWQICLHVECFYVWSTRYCRYVFVFVCFTWYPNQSLFIAFDMALVNSVTTLTHLLQLHARQDLANINTLQKRTLIVSFIWLLYKIASHWLITHSFFILLSLTLSAATIKIWVQIYFKRQRRMDCDMIKLLYSMLAHSMAR